MVDVLVDTQADATGTAHLYYVLGDLPLPHGLLDMRRRPARDVTDQIAARDSVRRFLEEIPLTDDELAAVEGDATKLDELVEKNKQLAPPRSPFARPATARTGRPRPVIHAHP